VYAFVFLWWGYVLFEFLWRGLGFWFEVGFLSWVWFVLVFVGRFGVVSGLGFRVCVVLCWFGWWEFGRISSGFGFVVLWFCGCGCLVCGGMLFCFCVWACSGVCGFTFFVLLFGTYILCFARVLR